MNTILVPLDGSALAEQVLPWVEVLAPALDAKVHLLEVMPEPERSRLLADSIAELYGAGESPEHHQARLEQALEEGCARAEGYLQAKAALLRVAGQRVDVEVRVGPAPENIVEAAGATAPRLIAMATHGYGGVRRWALGSVADRVVHMASAPVLLVRGSAEVTAAAARPLRRILVPLDGSGFARQALPFAAELATSLGAELLLLQAVAPAIEGYPNLFPQPSTPYAVVLQALRTQAQRELETISRELSAEHLHVRIIVASGHAAEAIVDQATLHAADLIVMATHGYSGVRRWALGSVADKVLHATTKPLILVRAQRTT
jgi:nucleotide-binding universal stress UspA family protein